MESQEADSALLELDVVSGNMPEALKSSFYDVIYKALESTGKFRLLPRNTLPAVPRVPSEDEPSGWQEAFAGMEGLVHLFVPRFEEVAYQLTGKPSWKITVLLFDLRDGKRLAMRETVMGKDVPPETLKWMVCEFADPSRRKAPARERRLAGPAPHPDSLKKDPAFLTTILAANLRYGAWDRAIETADELLALDAENALARRAKALALFKTGRH